MSDLVIYSTSNASQTGIVITDQTDWSSVGGSLSGLSDVVINLYGTSTVTPDYQYQLSPEEEDLYITDGTVEVLFSSIAGTSYLNDGWWTIQMTTDSGANISNYSSFGIYYNITFAVFNQINGLHVPEEIKYNAERYCIYAMWLEGLKFLDTTNVNSRGVKFQKRLLSLQKMLLKI